MKGPSQPRRRPAAVAYWLRLGVVGAATGLLILLLVYPPVLAYRLLHPQRLQPTVTPEVVGLAYEEVAFAGWGVELRGWYLPGSGDAGVVLVHGFPGERSGLLSIALPLHRAGFHLLLYDQRASGTSGGDTVTFGYFEADDVVAAAQYLGARSGVRRVGVYGASLGASVALLGAARGPDAIDAVVADSPFADLRALVAEGTPARMFGPLLALVSGVLSPLMLYQAEWQSGLRAADVRPIAEVARISPRPLLLIHGLNDTLYSHQNSVTLYEAAGEPKELWLVPETPHAGARYRGRPEYDQRVVAFFEQALGGAADERAAERRS